MLESAAATGGGGGGWEQQFLHTAMGRRHHRQVLKALGRTAPSNNCNIGHHKKNWAGQASRTDPANQALIPCSEASMGWKCHSQTRLDPAPAMLFPHSPVQALAMLFPHSPVQKGRQPVQLRGGTASAGGDRDLPAPGEDGQRREEMPSPEEMEMWHRAVPEDGFSPLAGAWSNALRPSGDSPI